MELKRLDQGNMYESQTAALGPFLMVPMTGANNAAYCYLLMEEADGGFLLK